MTRLLWVAVLLVASVGCRRRVPPEAEAAAASATARHAAWAAYRCEGVPAFPVVLAAGLEPAFRNDPAIRAVAYDCRGLRPLPRCHVEGARTESTLAPTEQRFTLETPAELGANLPALREPGTAPVLVTLRTRAVRRALLPVVLRPELRGECTGATHFVRGVRLGASALERGTTPVLRAGRLERCTAPGAECSEPVALELAPIVDDVGTQSARQREALTLVASTCPNGLVREASGRCTVPVAALPFACRPELVAECEAQCAAGHAGSCAAFGVALSMGEGIARDRVRAAEFLGRACDGKSAAGCVHLAVLALEQGSVNRDPMRAQDAQRRACEADGALGCYDLGYRFFGVRAQGTAAREAARYFERACLAGVAQGCNGLGYLLATGEGVPADPARALTLFRAACAAREYAACDSLGEALEKGWGTTPDPSAALVQYGHACTQGVRAACQNAARLRGAGKPASAGSATPASSVPGP